MKGSVIGISGKMGSGKDAIAARLRDRWGFSVIPFAYALKEEVLSIYPRLLAVLHDLERHAEENSRCSFAARQSCIKEMVWNVKPLGVRRLLQEHGMMRRNEDPAYWIKRWHERAADMVGPIAIPDVRYKNEAEMILGYGGPLWKVERPGTGGDTHESETEMDSFTNWSAVIQNDGTLEDLHATVDALMVHAVRYIEATWVPV